MPLQIFASAFLVFKESKNGNEDSPILSLTAGDSAGDDFHFNGN